MIKLAVLSNVNMDPLKNCFQKNSSFELYFCGYNRWQSDLLDTNSALYQFSPDYIFIYLNIEEYQGDVNALLSCITTYSQNKKNTHFIVSNFSAPPFSVATYTEKNDRIDQFNTTLNDFAHRNNHLFLFDFNRLIHWHGYKNLFDEKYWYLGRIKLSNLGFNVLANEIQNVLHCLQGKTKKVLILDLDNTLWGGVLGEEGRAHVQLSEEGEGRIFVDFQKKIKQLKELGVLLVSCSKNNLHDVKEMFENHPNMQLRWDDFILHKIDWKNKSDNIAEIAETLQLGLDAMVFIDDSRQERELIKQTLPQVEVPDFPQDIAQLNTWFMIEVVYPFFSKKQLTTEDKEKTTQYQRNINRQEIQKTMRYEDYLSSLQIKLTIYEPENMQLSRVAQLTQKTNQFNLTGKRYTDAEISDLASNQQYSIFVCEYEDKFGKEGIIGCAILQMKENKAIMDSFLLSCRVLGRNVENDFLKHILFEIKQKGIKKVEGLYNATTKNIAAQDFYKKNGFIVIDVQRSVLENL